MAFKDETNEALNLLAGSIFNMVRDDLYKGFLPLTGKRKDINKQNDISRVCEEVYRKHKKKEEGFNRWLKDFIAFLHWDFIDDCALYRKWKEKNVKRNG